MEWRNQARKCNPDSGEITKGRRVVSKPARRSNVEAEGHRKTRIPSLRGNHEQHAPKIAQRRCATSMDMLKKSQGVASRQACPRSKNRKCSSLCGKLRAWTRSKNRKASLRGIPSLPARCRRRPEFAFCRCAASGAGKNDQHPHTNT